MDELFVSFINIAGIPLKSGMLQKEYIALSLATYMLLLFDINIRWKRVRFVSLTMFLVITLFYLTSFFYPGIIDERRGLYISSLLYYGSGCVSSVVVGAHLACVLDKNALNKIEKLLPLFVIPIGVVVGTLGLQKAMTSYGEGGLTISDYQATSYIMSEVFAYCIYCLFFREKGKGNTFLLSLILAVLVLYSPIACVASGGRGGFVLCIIYLFFFIALFVKTGLINRSKLLSYVAIFSILLLSIAYIIDLEEIGGFVRIVNTLSKDDARSELYKGAIKLYESAPLFGHGIGSIWFNQGIYSHNIVLDLLAEIGLFGTIVVFIFLIRILIALIKLSYRRPEFSMILIVFTKGLVLALFSGYWLNIPQLWLGFGFVCTLGVKGIKVECSKK